MSREQMNEDTLQEVVGGFMQFNRNNYTLTYTHEETGAVTHFKVLDFDKAWSISANLHAQNVHEDRIIKILQSKKYIQ